MKHYTPFVLIALCATAMACHAVALPTEPPKFMLLDIVYTVHKQTACHIHVNAIGELCIRGTDPADDTKVEIKKILPDAVVRRLYVASRQAIAHYVLREEPRRSPVTCMMTITLKSASHAISITGDSPHAQGSEFLPVLQAIEEEFPETQRLTPTTACSPISNREYAPVLRGVKQALVRHAKAHISSGVKVPVTAGQTPCHVSSVGPPADSRLRPTGIMEVKRTQRIPQAVRGTVIP